jgi:broad specificity phosphatase PhoE
MLVYFVRHGESQANKKGLHHRPETPLTSEGKKQAEIVAERLARIPIDLIYSSTQKRAQQTAEIISQKIHKPIELWEELREIKTPKEIWGKSIDSLKITPIKELVEKNFYKSKWHYSTEENFFDLRNRAEKVLDHLLKEHSKETILCVTHGTILKMIMSIIMLGKHLTPRGFQNLRSHLYLQNTGITICEYSEKYGWTVNTVNDTTHL